ncbi:MAG: tRNA (adenosine(37)-N6)-threonylcarbamoyltransferase complex ATPase subunit type 1 TsaE [Candidatus Izemoplasmatales bacterium]
MVVNIKLDSLADTEKLAEIIANNVFKGMVIGLTGDLGSGKTTFTKFFAKKIGIKDTLNSPTFTIFKIYEGDLDLYHMDVYRLENSPYDYELDEYIFGSGISVIEWYEYIKNMLPETILEIKISVSEQDESRDVVIKGEGRYEKIVEAINNRYCN